VLILGIDNSGKTTLLEKIKAEYTEDDGLPPDKILPTVGLNIGRVEANNVKLVFWDLGGKTGLRSIWEKYYAEAHAVLFVMDASEPSRNEEAKIALTRAIASKDLEGAPVLVLANKQDVTGACTSIPDIQQALGTLQADRPSRPCKVQHLCALSGEGVTACVEWLIESMKRSRRSKLLNDMQQLQQQT